MSTKKSQTPAALAPMTKDEEIAIAQKLMAHDTYFRDEFQELGERICDNIRFDRPFLFDTGFANATTVQAQKNEAEKAWCEVGHQKKVIDALLDYILLSYKEDAIAKAYDLLGYKEVVMHKLAYGQDLTDDDKRFLYTSLLATKE